MAADKSGAKCIFFPILGNSYVKKDVAQYEKQILNVRKHWLVHGNLLDGNPLPGAAGFYANGPFLHLDVSHLWHGRGHRACIQASEGFSCAVAGQYLHGGHLFHGIHHRVPVVEIADMPLGLQPGGVKLQRADPPRLRALVVSGRTVLRENSFG